MITVHLDIQCAVFFIEIKNNKLLVYMSKKLYNTLIVKNA